MKRPKSKTPRGWIYARVGVDLLRNDRFLAIPPERRAASAGVWLAATIHCRSRKGNGFCPLGAIREIATDEIVDELVAVGLFAREVDQVLGHGVRVLKYEIFNETSEQIQSRIDGVKRRVRKSRDKQAGNGSVTRYKPDSNENKGGSNGDVPVSVSVSVSRSSSLPSPSQDRDEHSRDTTLSRSPAGDGAGGLAVSAWCDGIRQVTKGTVVAPRGQQLAQLNDAIRTGSSQAGEDAVDWARRAGHAFALEGGTLNVYRFVEFLASGAMAKKGPAPARSRHVGPDEAPLEGPAAEAEIAKLQATLARAGRLPEVLAP